MRLVLICVGKIRPPFADDVAHYERLLARHTRLETVELAEAGADPARALVKEAEGILKRIPATAHVCALDREADLVSSDELAALVGERRLAGTDLCFVVGGPQGLGGAVLERAQARISLGRITLPHQLARVVVVEQLFRAHKILAGEPYHY